MKKKLIEVALPLEAISKEAAREKSIRHGHPSTLHLWWSRKPLAACRAVLFASLIDDPSSHPEQFPTVKAQDTERQRLFKLIERLVKWENIGDEQLYQEAYEEILKSTEGNPPHILDPFAGGGSIPLEAQRLGLEAHASDLNPVAVLINKALIEIPPRFANMPPVNPEAHASLDPNTPMKGAAGLAEDVRYYGEWMKQEAFKRVGHLYPKIKTSDGKEATVIAWKWARTVKCPNPACGAEMPLVSSYWLSKKKGREAYVDPFIDCMNKTISFKVKMEAGGQAPEAPKVSRGAKFRCPICHQIAPDQHIKNEGSFGRMGSKMLAIVADTDNGREYLSPDINHIRIANEVNKPDGILTEELPYEPRAIWCVSYGLKEYKMTSQQRNWAKELQTTRNEWAHASGNALNYDDAARALDTMARFMEPIDAESADELRELMRQTRDNANDKVDETPATTPIVSAQSPSYVRPWRQIAEPHPDVAQGKYRQAEFAADLSQVLRGTAMPEYQDPVEFFARTYITDGMRGMLIKAAQRVAGKGGEPVIQLKTAFGGGKTHSMLALYHMMRAVKPDSLNGIPKILAEAGISSMPKVNVAVLVGTALDPAKKRRPITFPGITVNTIWGEMAAQLAEQSGNPKLYDLVKENDAKGVAPGSDTIRQLFDECAPCVVLIDELVAYARKLYGFKQGELPAGTFENVLSFVQELTEAARASKNSLVVASIPESETETGGEAGNLALERIEHTFGRMEAIWKPVVAEEGFEIVRRRLFRNINDTEAINQTCNAFFKLYYDNPEDFPAECHEASYLQKMKKCYPIHPEVFDRLYEDWATIEGFQRTRGVLRFMASVIHDLYVSNDSGAMIMPGSIAFGKMQIREELIRYLNPGWDAIIENEIDGRRALPIAQDSRGSFYGKYFAHSRIARTIFLGSAPDTSEQHVRGLPAKNIRLGVVQPEEHISTYNDALAKLTSELTYLYSSADHRYWYDTRPTLKKTVAERAKLLNADDVLFEIEKLLKSVCKDKEPFDAVNIAPASSGDVPDQQAIRLVLLSPNQTHKRDKDNSDALTTAQEYLEYRGGAPRMYRNMILFLAPDENVMFQLKQDMRLQMAWRSIERETESLNLDNAQKKETSDAIKHYSEVTIDRVQEAYQHLFVPTQNGTFPVMWEKLIVQGKYPVKKAAQKLISDDYLVDAFSPKILCNQMMQFGLWKSSDYLSVRELWEDYTRYLYLYRLNSYSVMTKTLEAGILSGEYFAYADGQDETGRFQGLCFGGSGYLHITQDGVLIKPEIAKAQIAKDNADRMAALGSVPGNNSGICNNNGTEDGNTIGTSTADKGNSGTVSQPVLSATKNTHFYGSVKIDANKLGSTAGTINAEVLQHLSKLSGAQVNITLDIQVTIPDGVPEDVARIICENCRTLKFENSDFGE